MCYPKTPHCAELLCTTSDNLYINTNTHACCRNLDVIMGLFHFWWNVCFRFWMSVWDDIILAADMFHKATRENYRNQNDRLSLQSVCAGTNKHCYCAVNSPPKVLLFLYNSSYWVSIELLEYNGIAKWLFYFSSNFNTVMDLYNTEAEIIIPGVITNIVIAMGMKWIFRTTMCVKILIFYSSEWLQ